MDKVGAPVVKDGSPLPSTGNPMDQVHNAGNTRKIKFFPDEQQASARSTHPRVATVDELKQSYIVWLKRHKPERLECKFEALLKEHEFEVLWTPPYCPDLQPIELFWAAGKNHVRLMFKSK
jgi:transposase